MDKASEKATAVILAYRKNRFNTRLIFGAPRFEVRRGWHRKLAVFYPGDVFGYERWRGDKFGTQDWTFVVCAATQKTPVTHVPGVMPGADLWLIARGKTKVKRAFVCLDHLETETALLQNQPEYRWRELHNLLQSRHSETDILAHMKAGLPC